MEEKGGEEQGRLCQRDGRRDAGARDGDVIVGGQGDFVIEDQRKTSA